MQILVLVAAVTWAGPALAAKTKLAVLPTQLDESAASEVPEIIDDYVLTAVQNAGHFEVIGQDDIETMLGFERQKELLGCDETACFAQIGGALGVEKLVVVKIARIEDNWATSAKLIMLAGEPRVENRTTAFIAGKASDLLKAVPTLVRRLFGASEEEAPLPAPPEREPLRETPAAPTPPPRPPRPKPRAPKSLYGMDAGVARLSRADATGFGLGVWFGYRFAGKLATYADLGYTRFTSDTTVAVTVSRYAFHVGMRYDFTPSELVELGLYGGLGYVVGSAALAEPADGATASRSSMTIQFGFDTTFMLTRSFGLRLVAAGDSELASDDREVVAVVGAGIRLAY